MNQKEYIVNEAQKAHIDINDEQAEKLLRYYEMLIFTNKQFNLTAITEFEEVVSKHFIDSLLPLSEDNVSRETLEGDEDAGNLLEGLSRDKNTEASQEGIVGDRDNVSRETFFKEGVSIIDIGTGAGFPGLPLKILLPQARVVLMDSLQKRVSFLEDVIDELKLTDVEAVHSRAEDAARDGNHREVYDICVSRAVAELAILAEYALPFVKNGGLFVAYKAFDCEEEIDAARKAIKELGGRIKDIISVKLPSSDIKRKLIFIEKIADTPDKYPRKAGTPSKKPIK